MSQRVWVRQLAMRPARRYAGGMSRGKTIRIYLVDGAPTGALSAEIINWTGKVLVFPRSQLPALAKREEIRRTGIYCLVGSDPETPSRDRVYIGEGDIVLTRLVRHDAEEAHDYWTRTAVVISKDENLTKSHVRYLESRVIQMAREAGRAQLQNGTSPPTPALPEADRADMEYFLEQIVMVFPVLGLGFLQPRPAVSASAPATGASPLFVLEKVGAAAKAREVDGQFVVLKGSTARKDGVESWKSYRGLRDQIVDDGSLVEAAEPGLLVFDEDVPFTSPSAAAAVVLARSANGRIEWRTADTGKTYADWQALRLRLAGVGEQAEDE